MLKKLYFGLIVLFIYMKKSNGNTEHFQNEANSSVSNHQTFSFTKSNLSDNHNMEDYTENSTLLTTENPIDLNITVFNMTSKNNKTSIIIIKESPNSVLIRFNVSTMNDDNTMKIRKGQRSNMKFNGTNNETTTVIPTFRSKPTIITPKTTNFEPNISSSNNSIFLIPITSDTNQQNNSTNKSSLLKVVLVVQPATE